VIMYAEIEFGLTVVVKYEIFRSPFSLYLEGRKTNSVLYNPNFGSLSRQWF